MVSFRGLIQNFQQASPPLSYAESPPPHLRLQAVLVACNNPFTYFFRLKLKASRHWLYP